MELKFRAWDKAQQYMAYSGTSDLETIQSFMHHWGDKPLMLWTGHYDKTGKPIFDKDIIEFDRKEWGGDDNIHIVSWNDYDAAWSFGGGRASSDMCYRTVIGNTYTHCKACFTAFTKEEIATNEHCFKCGYEFENY